MRVAAIQSNYLPWKGYFDIINDVDIFVFYDEVQYTKNDWRNRNQICTTNGRQWLSIPVAKDAVKLKISEVPLVREVNGKDWQLLHHKTLTLSYGGAPQFEQMKAFIDDIYLKHNWTNLAELNRFIIGRVCQNLGITTSLRDSKEFRLPDGKIERLLELLVRLKTTTYLTGPSGREYLEPFRDLFSANGITIEYKTYPEYPSYSQLSPTWENHVSIIDMIANVPWSEIPDYVWINRSQPKLAAS